ncbi:hypothetical protein K1Y78_47985 [Streptomyces sp. tea 10]|nr:hypothetical protein [Streptomyces sp. tea 10]
MSRKKKLVIGAIVVACTPPVVAGMIEGAKQALNSKATVVASSATPVASPRATTVSRSPASARSSPSPKPNTYTVADYKNSNLQTVEDKLQAHGVRWTIVVSPGAIISQGPDINGAEEWVVCSQFPKPRATLRLADHPQVKLTVIDKVKGCDGTFGGKL